MVVKKVDLLMIDCQYDFCNPNGTLFVDGAIEDMQNLAKFIKKNGNILNDIHATLDQHHIIDIAHPAY